MVLDDVTYDSLRKLPVADVRQAIREGAWTRHTAGLARGKLQCNLAILPASYALDFLTFCQRNPKPCPVVGISDKGDPMMPTLGHDIDIRTDVPQYRVFRDGNLSTEQPDIRDLWRDDLVTVALGCSFTFENALVEAGIPVRHIERNTTVPMYRSSIQLTPAGPFSGAMVITMRPIARNRVDDAIRISGQFPQAHGAPVAIGDPTDVGIADLDQPDWGEAVPVREDEVPVYWACGVTPQNVLRAANLPLCITHTPGCMLIADVGERDDTNIKSGLQPVEPTNKEKQI
ncbi:MAG: putative hydro-lyase [Loktanella sp.]|nr:putative hydro-lyase [Loktanella sp.]